MKSLVRTEGLTKIYGQGRPDAVLALDGADFSLDAGEAVALRGPSGSGKTTLLSLVGCMSRPTSGRIFVEGKDVAKLPERFLTAVRRRTFGFIFQQLNLIRDVSVRENIALPLLPSGLGAKEILKRVRRELLRFGLEGKERAKLRMLSGGEQQRVAIARALVAEPAVIVADEPTAHLDSVLTGELLRILEGLLREGKTIVIATHDPSAYGHRLVTRVVDMNDARIVSGGR